VTMIVASSAGLNDGSMPCILPCGRKSLPQKAKSGLFRAFYAVHLTVTDHIRILYNPRRWPAFGSHCRNSSVGRATHS
jgi:hypothetical protein